MFRSKLDFDTRWLPIADEVSHWFELFLSSRHSCRSPTNAQRSSRIEKCQPRVWFRTGGGKCSPSNILTKNVRCRSWSFINVRIRGLSGSSGLSVPGLVAGFRVPFVIWSRLQTRSSHSSLIHITEQGDLRPFPRLQPRLSSKPDYGDRRHGRESNHTNMHPTVLNYKSMLHKITWNISTYDQIWSTNKTWWQWS